MQQQPRLPLWFLVVNWALILFAFLLGTYLGSQRRTQVPEPQRTAFELVYNEVLDSYIEPQDKRELVERAISGMVDGLDKYSRYIPPVDVPEYVEATDGNYEGIGAILQSHGDTVVVHYPLPEGPAAAAGLLPGDELMAVDDEQLDTKEERTNISKLLRGPANSSVQLRIRRPDGEHTITVARGSVRIPCVKWTHMIDPDQGIGYLHLTGFHSTAAQQMFDAIESLEEQGELRGLIIDLRNDGGGSLDQCIAIARAFIPEGIITTQKKREPQPDEVYRARSHECRWPELPLVMLVNEHSASASEVLSGALQDHKRAVVVGKRTHGKGYVNTVFSWENYDFKLKLTTGSYRTPNGRNIERNHSTSATPADKDKGGIAPDVEVTLTNDEFLAMTNTLRAMEPPKQFLAGYEAVAKKHDFEIERPPTPTTDKQLKAAVEALK